MSGLDILKYLEDEESKENEDFSINFFPTPIFLRKPNTGFIKVSSSEIENIAI